MELGVQVKPPEEVKTATKYNKPDKYFSSSSKKSNSHPWTPLLIEGGPDNTTPSKVYIPHHGQQHYPKEGHARYNIFAYGCFPTVYHGINAAHKASYWVLMTFSEGICIKMHKFWNRGENYCHWVEHDNIIHGPVPPWREGFLVGNQM